MPRRSKAQSERAKQQLKERSTGQLIQDRPFPKPVRFAFRTTRWRLSDIEKFEDGRSERSSDDERWLTDRELAERYSVSRVTIWKWTDNARAGVA